MTGIVMGPLSHRMLRAGATGVAGVMLLTVSAKVQIPFWPVPMTLQTMAVMGLALAFGPGRAMAMVAGYIAAGMAGWPVFAGSPERGIGLAYILGPTGGYLAGYLAGAGLAGWLAQGRGIAGRLGAMTAGMAVVYACGLAWLAGFVPMDRLFALGAAPFLAGDAVKIAILAVLPGAVTRLRGMWG